MRIKFFPAIAFLLFFLLFGRNVLATGWWGDGVKSDEWILKHGGALVRFEIYNRQGESDEYKALLTRSGKKIEVELGKQGLFDEARDDRYKVTFYRGGNGRKSFDNLGSEIVSKSFNVHKGESIKLRLNYKTKKISFDTDYVKPNKEEAPIAKVQPKQIPIAVVSAPKEDPAEEVINPEKNPLEELEEAKDEISKNEESGQIIEDLSDKVSEGNLLRENFFQDYLLFKDAGQYHPEEIPNKNYLDEKKIGWFDRISQIILNFFVKINKTNE